jgi:hypothetical protein
MNKAELEELKLRVAKQMDVTQVLDILGFDMHDLVDILEDYINEQAQDFEEVL